MDFCGLKTTPHQPDPRTDQDGDFIMQDYSPSEMTSAIDFPSLSGTDRLIQEENTGPSFPRRSTEASVPVASPAVAYRQPQLSPPAQTDLNNHGDVQKRWQPWSTSRNLEGTHAFANGVTTFTPGPQLGGILPSLESNFDNIETSTRPVHDLSTVMTRQTLSHVLNSDQPSKRYRTSLVEPANRVPANNISMNRSDSSPSRPSPDSERDTLNRQLPPLNFHFAPTRSHVDLYSGNRPHGIFFSPNFESRHNLRPPYTTPFRHDPRTNLEYQDLWHMDTFNVNLQAQDRPDTIEQSRILEAPAPQPHQNVAIPSNRKRKQFDIKQIACTGCMDNFDALVLISLPCRCHYCPECLNRLVAAGCSTAADFPPKCHGQALRISTYGPVLDKETSDRYKQIEAEFSTQTPQYCAIPTCSAFIGQGQILETEDIGVCPMCNECTCMRCDTLLSTHRYTSSKRVCPAEDSDVAALRALGRRDGWMQCPACQTMIDKVDGCNHIACNCGVEFCYNCGSFYDEENLCECEDNEEGDSESDDQDSLDDGHQENEDDIEDEDDDVWPDHRRIFDSLGRNKCWHVRTHAAEGDLCHGCLNDAAEDVVLLSCRQCHAEFCQNCLDAVHTEHVKSLDREHEDAVWKILLVEQEQLDNPSADVTAVRNTKAASMQAHEANMVERWAPHQTRRKETWAEHKIKMELS